VQRAQPIEELIVRFFLVFVFSAFPRESMFLRETLLVYRFHVATEFANGVTASIVERI
jgi:hypothetical protein